MWYEIAVYSTFLALGNILFGHFEEKTPRWRRVLKYFVFMGIFLWLSATFGRAAFHGGFVVALIFLLIVHGWVLPKKGINGWTAEPKDKYYAFRGWSKD